MITDKRPQWSREGVLFFTVADPIIIMDLDPTENYSLTFDYKELRELLTHFTIIDKHEVSFTE